MGLAFGYVSPDVSAYQTYREVLVREAYQIAGKVYLSSELGLEWREYSKGQADTYDPTFRLAATYQPRETTTLKLEGERSSRPSFDALYNSTTTGFYLSGRQQLSPWVSVILTTGYQASWYQLLTVGQSNDRSDGGFSAGVAVDYEPNPHWKTSLFYSHRQQDSSLAVYSHANNLVGVQVGWKF